MKLLNMGIPIAFFVQFAFRKRKEKVVWFFLSIIGILSAPIILESTNLLWHGGSYRGYTMRFSYMLAFWIIVAGSYSIDQISIRKNIPVLGGICGIIVGVLQYLIFHKSADVYKENVSAVIVIILIAGSILAGLLLSMERKQWRDKWVLNPLIICEIHICFA